MWYGSPDDSYSYSHPYAGADGEDRFNPPDPYEWFDPFVQQFQGVEADLYVQWPLSGPWESHVPFHPYPLNLLEDLDHTSQHLPHHIPNSFPTTAQFQPLVPMGIPVDMFPSTAIRIDALGDGSIALPSTNAHSSPSQSIAMPSVFSDSSASSSTQEPVTADSSPSTSADTPSPSFHIDLKELTLPPEKLPLCSCDFGSSLTLGDALKKNFSPMSGEDRMRRAFPSRRVAAKLAFWLTFDLGDDFLPRRKQVTVVTTKKSVVEQPSRARLAYLVAHEMERYLKECDLRKKPFPYGLDDIVLHRIDLTSKGTVRPRLYIHVRLPD